MACTITSGGKLLQITFSGEVEPNINGFRILVNDINYTLFSVTYVYSLIDDETTVNIKVGPRISQSDNVVVIYDSSVGGVGISFNESAINLSSYEGCSKIENNHYLIHRLPIIYNSLPTRQCKSTDVELLGEYPILEIKPGEDSCEHYNLVINTINEYHDCEGDVT